ncbi:Uncharacterised protein g9352 [Pycnogonum litorale]
MSRHSKNYDAFTNGYLLAGVMMSEECLISIFRQVQFIDLFDSCQFVCKEWRRIIIHDNQVWCDKMQMLGKRIHVPKTCPIPKHFHMKRYLNHIFKNVNLILNPSGMKKFEHWKVYDSSDTTWSVERPPIGCQPVPKKAGNDNSCFVTSYIKGTKKQIVNLNECEIPKSLINYFNPKIYVCDWIASRWDCGSKYELTVQLLGANGKQLESFNWTGSSDVSDDESFSGQFVSNYNCCDHDQSSSDSDDDEELYFHQRTKWRRIDHIFNTRFKDVRKIIFEHSGVDAKFWAGYYGCKITCSTVCLKF